MYQTAKTVSTAIFSGWGSLYVGVHWIFRLRESGLYDMLPTMACGGVVYTICCLPWLAGE